MGTSDAFPGKRCLGQCFRKASKSRGQSWGLVVRRGVCPRSLAGFFGELGVTSLLVSSVDVRRPGPGTRFVLCSETCSVSLTCSVEFKSLLPISNM